MTDFLHMSYVAIHTNETLLSTLLFSKHILKVSKKIMNKAITKHAVFHQS